MLVSHMFVHKHMTSQGVGRWGEGFDVFDTAPEKQMFTWLNLVVLQVQLVGLDEESSEFICRNTFDHPYPTTKLMWIPDTKGVYPDLLATSGDYLRVWRVSRCSVSSPTNGLSPCQLLLSPMESQRTDWGWRQRVSL